MKNFDAERDIRKLAASWRNAFKVPEKVTSVADFVPAPPLLLNAGMRPIFRGEPEIYSEPLTPSLFRRKYSKVSQLEKHEISEIENAYYSYAKGDISDRFINAFAPAMHGHDLNWLFFARHIGNETRLLDVTINPLVALYFATEKTFDVEGNQTHKDGVVYFFQTSSYRPARSRYEDPLDERDYPRLPISYLELLSGNFDQKVHDVPYLVFPELPQERILAQTGGFFFWKNPEKKLREMRQVFPVIVDAHSKNEIRKQLESFGISREILFPNQTWVSLLVTLTVTRHII